MAEQLDLDALEAECKDALEGVHPDVDCYQRYIVDLIARIRELERENARVMACNDQGDKALAEVMGKLRALESRASNAGGAVAARAARIACGMEPIGGDGRHFSGGNQELPSETMARIRPAPASKEPVADERAAFEAIAKDQCLPLRRTGCTYDDDATQAAWAVYLQARAALATAQTWQPIETAPKDSEVWAFNGEQGRMLWSEGSACNGEGWALWIWADDTLADIDPEPEQPTHWMPLAAAPAKLEGV